MPRTISIFLFIAQLAMTNSFSNPLSPTYSVYGADYAVLETSPIRLGGELMLPIGLYHFPADLPPVKRIEESAEMGFNLMMLPMNVSEEELTRAEELGLKVMLTPRDLFYFHKAEDLDARKERIRELLGPGARYYESPAVVALEHPDEPLWNAKIRLGVSNREAFTWVYSATQQAEIHRMISGLKDAYEYVNEIAPARYSIWLNFAPRGHEEEKRWFSDLPARGKPSPDPRRAADVFGTDVYPVPDGLGNNGWVNARLERSPAAVGVFAARLRRAFSPYPVYMVLQGCGILDWFRTKEPPERHQRRPSIVESRFMAFHSLVHGARGILYWGTQYIESESLMWHELGQVAREVNAYAPVLLEGEPWIAPCAGQPRIETLAHIWNGEHVVLVSNPADWHEGHVYVPGWRGNKAWSLLDGRVVPVVEEVIQDTTPPMGIRIYSDGTKLFERFGRPIMTEPLNQTPETIHRTLYIFPLGKGPFEGKTPEEVARVLLDAGVTGVCHPPHDAAVIAAMRKAGIKVYGSMGMFSGTGTWESRPETRPLHVDGTPYEKGEGFGGVAPTLEWYVEDLLKKIDEKTKDGQLDGVWLDFIRWPGYWETLTPDLEPVGFNEDVIRRFHLDRAVYFPEDVVTTQEKAAWIVENASAEWISWRCEIVASVVARVRQVVKRNLGPDALLGIFCVPFSRAEHDGAVLSVYGQDWAKLAPYVDVFSPMVYHRYCGRDVEWIHEITEEVAQVSGKSVWPIIQAGSERGELSEAEFIEALEAAVQPPSRGVMIFTGSMVVEEGKWEGMAEFYNRVGE